MHKLAYLLLETPWQNPLATVYTILESTWETDTSPSRELLVEGTFGHCGLSQGLEAEPPFSRWV